MLENCLGDSSDCKRKACAARVQGGANQFHLGACVRDSVGALPRGALVLGRKVSPIRPIHRLDVLGVLKRGR